LGAADREMERKVEVVLEVARRGQKALYGEKGEEARLMASLKRGSCPTDPTDTNKHNRPTDFQITAQ
jgi:hypothetical protein